jgi:hypothetical protein
MDRAIEEIPEVVARALTMRPRLRPPARSCRVCPSFAAPNLTQSALS